MSTIGQEALPDVRKWSGGSIGCPEVVGRPSWAVGSPSRMSGNGWEAPLDDQEWSEFNPG